MQKLIIEDDEGRTTVVPLVRDELTIGRKEGNTIRLTERNVSRRHARLFKKNGDVCVEDFGSYTGVKVNGVRISAPTVLHDSDQVLIGDYKLAVRSEETAIETEQMPATVPGLPAAMLGSSGSSAAAPGALAGAVAQARADFPAPLDAAPTIPLRTLEEQGRAPQLPNAHPARLVVVTTELAGMEFRVDRPSLVIGRTEENDIILNHASISRHHAKVVRDGDRTTIVDLQSANGVRVAGESYERVDVQPGDVIELGHVKLRYVGPFEAWTYNPREFKPRSGRKVKVAAAGAGIALAVLLMVMLQGRTERKEAPAPVVAVAVPHPPAAPTPAALFAEATSAAGSENWDKAVSALDLLLSRPTTDPEVAAVAPGAVELKRKVDFERRSAEIFASFQKAVEDKEPDVALSRFEELPADSVYKGRAEPALADVKTLFLAAHLDLADSARTQGRCDEATAEVEKVQQIDPANRQARDIIRKCKARPAVAPAPAGRPGAVAVATTGSAAAESREAPMAPRPVTLPHPVAQPGIAPPATVAKVGPARPGARPATTRTPGAAGSGARGAVATSNTTSETAGGGDEATPADFGDLIRQAREAWMHQQCGSAIELSRRALRVRPGASDAHQIIAVCACSTKDKDGALRSYNKLDERSRAMVRTLCVRTGVELAE